MFLKLVLHNIESHEHTTIKFNKSSNGLIGATGSGKSVEERSLNSLLFFKTMKSRFDEPISSIELYHSKGVIGRYREDEIKWKCSKCKKITKTKLKRSKCCNVEMKVHRVKISDTYKINDKTFEVMGKGYNSLIDEIKEALPVALLDLGGKNPTPFPVGFKGQFDKFIWDELSGQELSRVFSYLEGHDYVHHMLEYVKKDIREDTNVIKMLKPEIAQIAESLKDAEDIILSKLRSYEEVSGKRSKLSDLNIRITKLTSIRNKYLDTIAKGKSLKEKLKALSFYPWKRAEEVLDNIIKLQVIKSQVSETSKNLKDLELVLSRIKIDSIVRVRDLLLKMDKLGLIKMQVTEKKLAYEELSCIGKQMDIDIKEYRKEFEKIITKENICPYSGFKLNPRCKKLILENAR